MEEICRVSPIASIYISSANSLSTRRFFWRDERTKTKVRPSVLNNEFKVAFGLTEPGAGSERQHGDDGCEGWATTIS
jgi:alkylation response protein AidB-like acyl-CoA dehydrogenase